MAFRVTENPENYNTDYLPDSAGFSIRAYREANSVRLILHGDGLSPLCIFKAYYVGEFSFDTKLKTGSYSDFVSKLTGFISSPLWRSTLIGVADAAGANMSFAFDAPYKPYIVGTEPISLALDCFLPLIEDDNVSDPFFEHIERPVNTLLKVVLPDREPTVEEARKKVEEKLNSFRDELFDDKDSMLWKIMNKVTSNLQKDFFNDVYMLTNPIQFRDKNYLTLRIGPNRISPVFVESVRVTYGPITYSDGTKVYPAYARVVLQVRTNNAATHTSLGIGSSYDTAVDGFAK